MYNNDLIMHLVQRIFSTPIESSKELSFSEPKECWKDRTSNTPPKIKSNKYQLDTLTVRAPLTERGSKVLVKKVKPIQKRERRRLMCPLCRSDDRFTFDELIKEHLPECRKHQ